MNEQTSVLTSVVLPAALGIIMLGLGLSLTIADFTRVVKYPKAVFIGLLCQMVILPVVCFGIAKVFGLDPIMAVGLMLLAASPGGATANLYSHLSNGDVALNITLTAINSVLTLVTLPLILLLSMQQFLGEGNMIAMPYNKIIEVFAIVLVPVSIGMLIRAYAPKITEKLEKPVKIASAILLVVVIAGAISKEKDNLALYFQQVGIAALVFNLLSLAVGFYVPRLFNLSNKQSIAIGMEIGIHNGTLAIFIAQNVLMVDAMAFPPAIYSIIMFFTAAAFGFLVNRLYKPSATEV